MPIGGNWWVDHRVFRPFGLTKDVDLIMVSAFGSYQRHERVFAALATLKRRGKSIRTVRSATTVSSRYTTSSTSRRIVA